MKPMWQRLVLLGLIVPMWACTSGTDPDASDIPEGFYGTFYVNGVATHSAFTGYLCRPSWDLQSPSGDPYYAFIGSSAGPPLLSVQISLYESELESHGTNDAFISPELGGAFLNAGQYESLSSVVSWDGTRGKMRFSWRSGGTYELKDGKLNLAIPSSTYACP